MTVVPAPAPPQRSLRKPPPLSEAYRKAHRNYVLASALLLSWQLIGIEFDTKDKWGIVLKSPVAIPIILFVLVIYFGFRVVIEWHQCDEDRRGNKFAWLDYKAAHGIAVATMVVCFSQGFFHVQLVSGLLRHHRLIDALLVTIIFGSFQVPMIRLATSKDRILMPKFKSMLRPIYWPGSCFMLGELITRWTAFLSLTPFWLSFVHSIVVTLRIAAFLLLTILTTIFVIEVGKSFDTQSGDPAQPTETSVTRPSDQQGKSTGDPATLPDHHPAI